VVLFGTDGLITHITLIIGAVYVLGGLIFRKSIANDILGYPFSVYGSCTAGILLFIILDNTFDVFKISVVVSLIGFFLAGFLLSNILGDGEVS